MKKMCLLVLLLLTMLVGCKEEIVEEEAVVEVIRNVKVDDVSPKNHMKNEKYVGTIASSDVQKISFEVGGKLNLISFDVGEQIKKGDLIATLDTENYQFALDAAKAEYSASNAQYSKAKEALEFYKSLYEDNKKLYTDGVISQQQFDEISFNYSLKQDDVSAALGLRNQASTNVKSKEYTIDNTKIYSSRDCVVINVLADEGEMIEKGHPLLITRNEFPVMTFGVAQRDYKYLEIGLELKVHINETEYSGSIDFINQIPDATTQTYEVNVKLEENDIPLGSIATVYIPTKEVFGVLIPVRSIKSDGDDYIFIVEDNQAKRLNVKVEEVINQMVIISGIENDEMVIVSGMMGVVDGDQVRIIEE